MENDNLINKYIDLLVEFIIEVERDVQIELKKIYSNFFIEYSLHYDIKILLIDTQKRYIKKFIKTISKFELDIEYKYILSNDIFTEINNFKFKTPQFNCDKLKKDFPLESEAIFEFTRICFENYFEYIFINDEYYNNYQTNGIINDIDKLLEFYIISLESNLLEHYDLGYTHSPNFSNNFPKVLALLFFIGNINESIINEDYALKKYKELGFDFKTNQIKNIKSNTKRTFQLLPGSKLNKLFNNLKKENFISHSTEFKDFKKIFNNLKLNDIEPINFKMSSAQIVLFYQLLVENNFINKTHYKWEILRFCFYNKNDDYKNLRKLYNQLDNQDDDLNKYNILSQKEILKINKLFNFN